MKKMRVDQGAALLIAAIAFGTAIGCIAGRAVADSINSAGVTLSASDGEEWTASGQQNAAGVTLELAGLDDSGLDASNGAGASVFVGTLDPGPILRNAAGVSWKLYD